MEEPLPVGEDNLVAIAVNKGKGSQAALKWAIENLLVGGGVSVNLVHVRSKPQAFDPTTVSTLYELRCFANADLHAGLVEGFRDIHDIKARDSLLPFESYCRKKKIQSELVILEDNDTVKAITDYVLANHVDVLVVGAESKNRILKKLKGLDVAKRVSKRAPYFCTVYTIAMGKLQSVRYASSTAHTLTDTDVNNPEHNKSIHEPTIGAQLTCNGSSVSSRTALLQPDPVNDFEFRSPLQNHGHSDFSIGGLAASESDISFVSNDREYNNCSSSGYSTNSSDWSLGSFEPSYATLSSSSSHRNNGGLFGLSPSDSLRDDNLDELQRLHLELIKSKRIYESVCDEALDAETPTSNMTSLNLKEDWGMERKHKSSRPFSKFESRRFQV